MNFILDARTAAPHFPGIGRYVRSLAVQIPPLLHTGEALSILHAEPGEAGWLADLPADVSRVPVAVSPFSLQQQWALPRYLKGAGLYHSPYYLMPYRPGVPTVLTVYDLIPQLFPKTVSLRARLVFTITTRLALAQADHVLCISEATRRDFLARFPRLDPAVLTAVPLAPAPQFLPQPEVEQARVRQKYSLPDRFILFVGSNKPHKNLSRLVEAWGLAGCRETLIIGGAWDPRYPDAQETAGRMGFLESGKVRFLGRIPDADLPGLYSACSLFVFPSLYEGFGLPVVEALACGAAVACSNTSSLPEVGGDAVTYFHPHSTEDIAAALNHALAAAHDPARSVIQAAAFSWSRTAASTVEIYRSIAYNNSE